MSTSTGIKTIHTAFGEKPLSTLNLWDNTVFSKYCLDQKTTKADLLMLMNSTDLDFDKQDIAAAKLQELYGNQV